VSIEREGKGERGRWDGLGIINPATVCSSSLTPGGATAGPIQWSRHRLRGRKKKLTARSPLSARRRRRRGGGLLPLRCWAAGQPTWEGEKGKGMAALRVERRG
jgi:hypothetical protein